jgi:hypothetical protein
MPNLRALIESGLVEREDGTIFDTTTKLLWQQSPSDETFTWKEAERYCRYLTLAGHSDWRLPTIEELRLLINRKYQPTIDPIFKCKSGWYWSSSTLVGPDYAWYVGFSDGVVFFDYKGGVYFVRAVRG